MRLDSTDVDAFKDHLERIRAASPKDWHALIEHFVDQCEPLNAAELRPIRPGRVPEDEWESSQEFAALTRMLGRCWPSERSQRQ
jgi:hypothetical protein